MVEREQKRAGVWLGRNVRERRERQGLSQNDVAAAMTARGHPWHQVTVYRVESGSRTVEVHEALALAELFETSVGDLVSEPHLARRRWALEAKVARLDKAYQGLYDVVWTLLDAQVELAGALEHVHPEDDPDVITDARTALAEHTLEAVSDSVRTDRAVRLAEAQALDVVRQEAEDAEDVYREPGQEG